MKEEKTILNELQGIAPVLAKLDKINFYQVQQGYFEQSIVKIVALAKNAGVEAELPPVLSGMEKKALYVAPPQPYFEVFSDAVMNKIHAEEVAEELSYSAPLLLQIDKQKRWAAVPVAYFSSFPDAISRSAAREDREQAAPAKGWRSKWDEVVERVFGFLSRPAYAFAMASVVGILVCIALVVNNGTLSAEDKIFAEMQQIPDSELHYYIASHQDEFDEHTILHNIKDVEFIHYFDKPEQVTPHIENHINGIEDDELNSENILD